MSLQGISYLGFSYCICEKKINLQKLNHNIEYMNKIYFNNYSLKNMSYMFYGFSSVSSINLANFNTNNVENMSYMFYNCSSLTSLIYLILILIKLKI